MSTQNNPVTAKFFQANFPRMLEDLKALCQVPSVMGEAKEGMPFGEEPYRALQVALSLCEKQGLILRDVEGYVGEAELSDQPPVLGILCHLDVVPAGEGWSVPPYDLTCQGETLLGRGVIDDKGPFVSALYALSLAKELAKAEGKELKNVRLIFGTNEENGSADLAYSQQKREYPPLVFTPDGEFPVIHIEKGAVHAGFSFPCAGKDGLIFEISGGQVLNAVPASAKAVLSASLKEALSEALLADETDCSFQVTEEGDRLQILAQGVGAHASTPKLGVNSLTALLALLDRLPLQETEQQTIHALCQLFPFGDTQGIRLGLEMEDSSGPLTYVFSKLDFSPEKVEGGIDIRFPIMTCSKEVLGHLTDAIVKEGGTLLWEECTEPHGVDENLPFVQTLLEVYHQVTGGEKKCIAIGGGTYVHHIENGVAFGACFPGVDNHMHGPDEWISTTQFQQMTEIYANAILRLAGVSKQEGRDN